MGKAVTTSTIKPPVLWVFAHGWSNASAHWLPLLRELDAHQPGWRDYSQVWLLEQNYYSPSEPCLIHYPTGQRSVLNQNSLDQLAAQSGAQNILGVGHSLGFAKLVHWSDCWTGLVSLHGFTRFCADHAHQSGTPARVLRRMVQQFRTQPAQVLHHFKLKAGLAYSASKHDQFSRRLLDDLIWMETLDVSSRLQLHCNLNKPLHVAWSTTDSIVPAVLSEDCFEENVRSHREPAPYRVTLATPHEGPSLFPSRYTSVLTRL
ncbi:MAG: alpha/beta hydrolase, partial [Limnobacter sp.]|nr:alpha/beta hydrolase [Limnobacter sp.]